MKLRTRLVGGYAAMASIAIVFVLVVMLQIVTVGELLTLQRRVSQLSIAWYEFEGDASSMLIRSGDIELLAGRFRASYERVARELDAFERFVGESHWARGLRPPTADLRTLWTHATAELDLGVAMFDDFLVSDSGRYLMESYDMVSLIRRVSYANRLGTMADRGFVAFERFLDQLLVFYAVGESFERLVDTISERVDLATHGSIRRTLASSIVIGVAALATAVFFGTALVRTTVRRLGAVGSIVSLVAERNRDIHTALHDGSTARRVDLMTTPLQPEDDHGDEISELVATVSDLVESERALASDVASLAAERREAELEALQAQVNPHFLYNTLDTVRWEARRAGAGEVAELVRRMSDFFRLSLSRNSSFVTLARELQHVRAYVELEQMRSDLDFVYREQIDDRTLGLPVLRFVLQPLVENAIHHGIVGMGARGLIRVAARVAGGRLVLEVADNGVGVSADRDRAAADGEEHGSSHGYGLRNIRERIRFTYGDGYGLRLRTPPGGGTEVTVDLPLSAPDSPGSPGQDVGSTK